MSLDPKYANLPWIAHDQPDVYEAGELPEADQSLKQDLTEDAVLPKEIEVIKLSANDSYKRFAGCKLDASKVDFSDSIAGKGKIGYTIDTDEYDVLSSDSREKETLMQKFQRLQVEVRQLAEDVTTVADHTSKSDEAQPVSANQLAQLAEGLADQLSEVKMEVLAGHDDTVPTSSFNALKQRVFDQIDNFKPNKDAQQGSSESNHIVYELFDRPSRTKDAAMEKAADLDRRIQRLEALLGKPDPSRLSALTADTARHSLLEAAARLSARSALLQPGHLDFIETRLAALQTRLQSITEKRETIADADTQNKIAALYELVNKWNDVADSLPTIVQRLTALKTLHDQASEFNRSLEAVETGQQSISAKLESYGTLLKSVQANLAENMNIIKENILSLEQRLPLAK